MKLIARLIVSLERFWSDPAKWWGRLPGGLKFGFAFLSLPVISVTTILLYQARMGASTQQLTELGAQQQVELTKLRQELSDLRSRQEKLLKNLTEEKTLGLSTLAAQIRARVQTSLDQYEVKTETATSAGRVYVIPGETTTTKLYQKPDKASHVVANIPTDAWYLVIMKQEGWYELQLEESRIVGWIPMAQVVLLN